MCHAGRFDGKGLLELDLVERFVVEESYACAEETRNEVEEDLVDQPGGEVLLCDGRAPQISTY
jgi:hypothetical protein